MSDLMLKCAMMFAVVCVSASVACVAVYIMGARIGFLLHHISLIQSFVRVSLVSDQLTRSYQIQFETGKRTVGHLKQTKTITKMAVSRVTELFYNQFSMCIR